MDETPVLARHPLHTAQRFKTKLPQPEAKNDKRGRNVVGSLVVASDGSETEGVSEEEVEAGKEWTPKITREDPYAWKEDGSEDDDDPPSTQIVDPRPLAGLYVYVDVRSGADGCENRSGAISHQLTHLGATVCVRFTKDVTHVVFKDGKTTTKERAEKKKVFLVSPLWVEASKRANDRVSEAKYPVLCKDGSDTPIILGKIKRIKSMQPKELEEEISKSLERSRKRHKSDDKTTHAKRRALPALPSATTPLSMSALSMIRDVSGSENEAGRNSEEEEEVDFDLPAFKLPGTPVTDAEEGGTATPVDREKQRTKARKGASTLSVGVTGEEESGRGGQGCTGAAKKRRSGQDSAGSGGSERKQQKKKVDVKSGGGKEATKGGNSRKEKTDDGGDVKVSEVVSKKRSSLKQSSLNGKGSKVSKRSPPPKKKRSLPVALAGKENADSTPDLLKQKEGGAEGSADRPKKRRRVQFKSKSLFERKKPTLVLTSVEPEDQDMIVSIVDKLGRFEVSRTVCETTTHVVCGNPRRTINILAATAMGCWIMSTNWVWKSVESGAWLDEEPYEMADHFPSARLYRLERQSAGLLFRPRLFSSAGSVFVSSSCSNPPSQQLERLLTLTGGKVSGSQRKADVCVGGKSWNKEVTSVSEQWILDSITEHQLLPLEDYLLDCPHLRAGSPEL